MIDACLDWCAKHTSTKLLRLIFTSSSIAILASGHLESVPHQPLRDETIIVINADGQGSDRMADAGPVFETLRRRLEESNTAILDGYALLQFCHTVASETGATGLGWHVSVSDVSTSEIILMRDDHDLGPDGSFEVARGDELYCWSQLNLALEGRVGISGDEDGAWRSGDARFVWKVATIHPKEYVPGLTISQRIDFGKNLLRRHRLAHRILGGAWPRHRGAKHIADLESPRETLWINLHKLLLEMNKAGLDWAGYCAEVGETLDPKPDLPMGFVMALIERLRPNDPNQLFGLPTRSELALATDDQVLRTLMPRAQRAIYRLPVATIRQDQREAITEAVNDFSASLAIRSGMVMTSDDRPQKGGYLRRINLLDGWLHKELLERDSVCVRIEEFDNGDVSDQRHGFW